LLSKELIACSDGTEITINSLFDNLEKRREALNKSEEKKIVL
jgi:DNA mismatch repair ATPase MutL